MNSPQLLKEIGKQIAIIRNRAGLSQFSLNRMCGMYEGKTVKECHLAKLEKGELNVTLETLAKIAKCCDAHIDIKLRSNRRSKIAKIAEEYPTDIPEAITRMREAM